MKMTILLTEETHTDEDRHPASKLTAGSGRIRNWNKKSAKNRAIVFSDRLYPTDVDISMETRLYDPNAKIYTIWFAQYTLCNIPVEFRK